MSPTTRSECNHGSSCSHTGHIRVTPLLESLLSRSRQSTGTCLRHAVRLPCLQTRLRGRAPAVTVSGTVAAVLLSRPPFRAPEPASSSEALLRRSTIRYRLSNGVLMTKDSDCDIQAVKAARNQALWREINERIR